MDYNIDTTMNVILAFSILHNKIKYIFQIVYITP